MVINPKIAKLDTSYYRRRCRVGAPPFVEGYNFFFFTEDQCNGISRTCQIWVTRSAIIHNYLIMEG